LFIIGDTSLNSNLFVDFDTSLNSRLVVGSDVTMNKRLFTVGDSSLNGNLFVAFDTSLNSRLVVGSDATINNRLFTVGDSSLNGNLFVALDTSLNSRLVVGSDVTVNKQLFTMGDTSLNGNLFVDFDSSLNGNLNIGKDLTINGRLTIKNYTNTSVINTTVNNYQLIISEDISLNGRLLVSSDSSMNGNLYIAGTLSAANYATNSIPSSAIIGGVASSSSTGDFTTIGNLFVNFDTDLNSRLVVESDVTINKRLFTIGDASFSGNLYIGSTTASSSYSTGALIVNGGAGMNGNIYFSNNGTGLVWGSNDSQIKDDADLKIMTNDNMRFYTANSERMIINSSGYVGIGTTTPQQALVVNGTIQVNSTNAAYNKLLVLYDGNTSEAVSGATNFAGFGINSGTLRYQVGSTGDYHTFYAGTTALLYLSSNAASPTPSGVYVRTPGNLMANNLYLSSDKRIKYNIHDLADIPFLEILRYLKPRIFNYIDEMKNGCEPVLGFIAQEVAEIIPSSITYTLNYIPNIYELAEIIGKEIKLGSKTTTELLKDETGYYPLKLMNTKDEEIIVKITEIIDEKTFKIDQEIETEYNKVFVYGQEIPDFHGLDKDQIFTITTAAVQEIDKELQETKNRVKLLEEENQQLKQQITEILERLTNANI
jgi:predicted acyltransferase (DUF342 family)